MTTRVLQAFDTLDDHSNYTLGRLAKKNLQLTQESTQCFVYGRSDTGLGLYREFGARKKAKANEEIVRNEQELLYKRLRKSFAVSASMKGNSCRKSVEAGSSGVVIPPEIHATNVKPSTSQSMRGGKEEIQISFVTMPKKSQTLRPYSQSPSRMTWSREVEKVPSLQELTKVNRSKALLGLSLGDPDISHWCSSSVHSELDAPFSSPVPDGLINTQQHSVQVDTDHISTGNVLLQNKTEKEVCAEPVPLSFDDLLKRKDMKVLAPRPHKVFLSEQKASETYPVVYSTQQRQYKPFSSPGFHSLDPPTLLRKRSLRSSIILYTEAMQAKYMIRRIKERQAREGLGSYRPYSQPELSVNKTGVNCVNMRVLTADGKVIRSPDLARLPLHYRDETPALRASTASKKISLIPKQNVLTPCVGPVINGMNPNQTCESGKISPAWCKAPPASPRRSFSSSAHTSTPQTRWGRSRNQIDFLTISRPLKCCENGVNCIIREKQLHNEDRLKEANEPYKNAKAEVCDSEDCDAFSENDMRSPRETLDAHLVSPCTASDSEETHKDNALFYPRL